jgi:glycolate oxidase FAD binding subunit
VITRAIFRLHPLPKETRTVSRSSLTIENAQRLVLEIQNSKLAYSAMQVCCDSEMRARVDVLLEGTEAGLTAQVEHLMAMTGSAVSNDAWRDVWNARQEIFSAGESGAKFAVGKFASLPTEIGETIEMVARVCGAGLGWNVVAQATGIGWVRAEGAAPAIDSALRELRGSLEGSGGSLAIAHRPTGGNELDAWGNAGDALEVMRAVKRQFDIRGTLNPGRFVGGI